MALYFNLNNNEISKELLVNQSNMMLDNQGRRVLNGQKISSPYNKPQILPVFVQKQPPKVFLKILQILQENTYSPSGTCNFIKKRLQYWCFPVTFAKFLTSTLKNICKRLPLFISP